MYISTHFLTSQPTLNKLYNENIGGHLTPLQTATISIFLSDAKCSTICRAQTCAHSGAEPSRSAKGFLQGGPKSSKKNFEFFTISRLYVHISQKLLKIVAYKQRMEKSFISPLSKCRMCLDHRSRHSIG